MRIEGRKLTLAVTICLCSVSAALSQTACIELKHYEFFLSGTKERWSEGSLENLIEAKPNFNDSGWLIPAIVEQLKRYEPACGTREMDRQFELLLQLYSVVRGLPVLADASVSSHDKLRLMRNDFQMQLNDDRGFDHLIYSMDDGPLTGKPISAARAKPLASRNHDVPFGKLRFSNTRTGVVVTALGRTGRELWSRSLQGVNPKRPPKAAQLETLVVEQTDFVVAARISVDGEKLTLYVRPNGRFMFYRHSW